jgi:dihydroneopterin aldolase
MTRKTYAWNFLYFGRWVKMNLTAILYNAMANQENDILGVINMGWCKLALKNMIFYGYHGVYPAEKELGQRIEVDVELWADFLQAVQNDKLDATINYVIIYNMVRDIVEQESYDLIEAMTQAICERISDCNEVQKVIVRVRKPQPPAGGLMDAVEFEICHERE